MKHIKTFEDKVNESVINLSKKRAWDKYPSGGSKLYDVYDLGKSERGKYLNTWFKGEYATGKSGMIYTDEYITLKKCDEETADSLYHKEYNPVSIRILCLTGAKVKLDENKNQLYNMKAQIHSIDDSSFGVWWEEKPYDYLVDAREKLMKWVNTQPIINGEEFLDKSIELGADESTKDYN